ncbi:MAG TPA: hypothetical protein VNV38_01190 [Stellaceae bacterium]|jgi:hypothetical protein|nr:hypothetical protein [Stellaceae bacterium]
MFGILGKAIKGIFYLALLLVVLGFFVAKHAPNPNDYFSTPSVEFQSRCDHYNSQYKCEAQFR